MLLVVWDNGQLYIFPVTKPITQDYCIILFLKFVSLVATFGG